MIGKDQLVFDTTNAQSIADSDSVGAFVRSAGGTLITHTTAGGKEALDVNIAGGVSLEVDLDHTEDSVRLGNGVAFFTSTTIGGDIGLDVNLINASIEVTATDLDIRGITAVSDSIQSRLHDGAGTALTSTLVGADQALDVNVVASEDLTVNDAALANTAIATVALSLAVANTAQDVVAAPLANRKYLYIKNMSNQEMYIGASGVTAANGFPLSPSAIAELRIGAAVDIEFVGRTGTTPTIRTMQLS